MAITALVRIITYQKATAVRRYRLDAFDDFRIRLKRMLSDDNIPWYRGMTPVCMRIYQYFIARLEHRRHRDSGDAVAPPEPQ